MRTYSTPIANQLGLILRNNDWKHDFDADNGIFHFGVGGIKHLRNLSFRILVGDDFYTIYSLCPIAADIEDSFRRNEMTEFICRANYGLRMGCFELDVDDGEIRFKINTPVIGERQIADDELLTPLNCAGAMFAQYAEGLIGIIFKALSAKEAIDLCE